MALSEEKWLGRRAANEMAFDAFFCPHCSQFNVERDPYLGHCDDDTHCPLANQDFRDAAEFEARVALELTDYDASYRPSCPDNCRSIRNCRECHLMYARLAVEAEMDNTAGSK